MLVACATAASLFPYVGTIIYTILRPPEFLEDAKERELEIRAAELRCGSSTSSPARNCEYPGREAATCAARTASARLKDPCQNCDKPLDPRWAICPYCETERCAGRQRQQREAPSQRNGRAARRRSEPADATTHRPASPVAARASRRLAQPSGKRSDWRSRPRAD